MIDYYYYYYYNYYNYNYHYCAMFKPVLCIFSSTNTCNIDKPHRIGSSHVSEGSCKANPEMGSRDYKFSNPETRD